MQEALLRFQGDLDSKRVAMSSREFIQYCFAKTRDNLANLEDQFRFTGTYAQKVLDDLKSLEQKIGKADE